MTTPYDAFHPPTAALRWDADETTNPLHDPTTPFAWDGEITEWVRERPDELHALCLLHPPVIDRLDEGEQFDILCRELRDVVLTLPPAKRVEAVQRLLEALEAGNVQGLHWYTFEYWRYADDMASRSMRACGCVIGSLYSLLLFDPDHVDPEDIQHLPSESIVADLIERNIDAIRPVNADAREDYAVYGSAHADERYDEGKPEDDTPYYWRRMRPIERYAIRIRPRHVRAKGVSAGDDMTPRERTLAAVARWWLGEHRP